VANWNQFKVITTFRSDSNWGIYRCRQSKAPTSDDSPCALLAHWSEFVAVLIEGIARVISPPLASPEQINILPISENM